VTFAASAMSSFVSTSVPSRSKTRCANAVTRPLARRGSGGERLAATAGALRLRVHELEPGAVQAGDPVERGAREVLRRRGIDEHPHAVEVHDVVVGLLLIV